MGIYKDRSAGTPFYLFMARSPAVIAGLRRTYTRAVVTPADEYVLLTTVQGDFSVFNIPNMIYRSSVPVSSNGAMTLCLSRHSLYAGSGDGKLKKLQGSDLEWEEIGD
jgi:hypothetical protein